MTEIKLELDNSSHTNISVPTNDTGTNIGLELLMNDSKKRDTKNHSPSHSPPPIEDFNLDALLNNNSDTLNSIKLIDTPSNEIKLDEIKLDEINLDTLPEDKNNTEKLDSNIFSINTNSSPSINNNTSQSIPTVVLEKKGDNPKSFEELQKDKFNLLCNLERLEQRGFKISKTFSMESDFTEMKREYDRITRKLEIDKSVRFQRKMMIAFVTAIEFLNTKFDPMDVKLDGWSESVHENVNDYDDIFEELHDKYKHKADMGPELKLILMLGGSGFMFHLTQSIFKTSIPGVGDIMKQNPDLMNQFAKAAANASSSPGFGNFMGGMMDDRSKKHTNRNDRSEMRGPPDINDILSKVNTTNNTNINLDNLSNVSDSDIENIRNIDIKKKTTKKSNVNEITLDF